MKVNKLENLSYKGILYGKVIAKAIDFLVIAFTLFLIIKYAHIQLPA
ncbi:MAG: MscL family protein [Patescibacteria group bacterium]|nr:MscL family protein [Patescibacteria group bacterium]